MELPGTPNFHPNPQFQPPNDPFDNIMARSNYIDPADDGFAGQMQTFKSGIGGYGRPPHVTPASAPPQAAERRALSYAPATHRTLRDPAPHFDGSARLPPRLRGTRL